MMFANERLWLLMFGLLLPVASGCHQSERASHIDATTGGSIADTVASNVPEFEGGVFEGVLPCASCPGIETRIEFRNDHSYWRYQTYQDVEADEDGSFGEFGRWSLAQNGRLILTNTEGGIVRFDVTEGGELRLTDTLGKPIESKLDYNLRGAAGSELPESYSLRFVGMYTYMADAAIFRPCNTLQTFPVTFTDQHVDLEKKYLEYREAPGAPLMVQVTGALEQVPSMEYDDVFEEALVVHGVDEVYPGIDCRPANSSADSTNWLLSEIDGVVPTIEAPNQRPRLTIGESVVTGTTGCNSLRGPVDHANGKISFGAIATTRRACPGDLEASFLAVIAAADSFQVYKGSLELFSDGFIIASFTEDLSQP